MIHKRCWFNYLSVHPAPIGVLGIVLNQTSLSLSSDADLLTSGGLVNLSICSTGDLRVHLGKDLSYITPIYAHCANYSAKGH